MITPVVTPEPLSDDEAAWLMKIYTLRRKDLFFAGSFRCFLRCFVLSAAIVTFTTLASSFQGVLGKFLIASSAHYMGAIIVIDVLLTVGTCWFVNNYMIVPYRKDAECGKKLRIPQKILAKEYYPVTGQYFFRLENNYDNLQFAE